MQRAHRMAVGWPSDGPSGPIGGARQAVHQMPPTGPDGPASTPVPRSTFVPSYPVLRSYPRTPRTLGPPKFLAEIYKFLQEIYKFLAEI